MIRYSFPLKGMIGIGGCPESWNAVDLSPLVLLLLVWLVRAILL